MEKDSDEIKYNQTLESSLKQVAGKCEFWSARKLAKELEYFEYLDFVQVIDKAKKACENSGHNTENHFVDVHEIVLTNSGLKREVSDMKLSRFACYLIVQNADPKRPVVASGQIYFAIQTRRQELSDNITFQKLTEDERHLFLINELKEENKQLFETAKLAKANVPINFAIFQNHGYRGLHSGLDSVDK